MSSLRMFVLAVLYGLVQGLIFVFNYVAQDVLGGRPYYLMR